MTTLAPSQVLAFQIAPNGRLAASLSGARSLELEAAAIAVLCAFAGGATTAEAVAHLQKEWDTDGQEIESTVRQLLDAGLLVPVDPLAPRPLAEGGFAHLVRHHFMLRDTMRVFTYKAAIQRHVAGRSVVEIGCGTGILSIFAAQAGARKVVAIEETRIAALAREMIAANGLAGVVELREGNSRDVVLDERADVLVHEIIGLDPLDEGILGTIADARRRLLKDGGRMIPHRLQICLAAYSVPDEPYYDRTRALADAREYAGLYGVDFAPYLARLEARPELDFPPPIPVPPPNHLRHRAVFPADILSEEQCVYDLDFRVEGFERPGDARVRLRIHKPGLAGGVLVYFRAHLDEETQLTNGPFVPLTSWGWDARPLPRALRVAAGDEIEVAVRVATVAGHHQVIVEVP